MLRRIKAFWELLQAGKTVGNPATWKQRQIGVSAIHGLLWAAITAWAVTTGSGLEISEEALNGISVALLTAVPALIELFTITVTVITTTKVGLPARNKVNKVG